MAFCPDFFCGWHFVRPILWFGFCPDHLNMFWHFVRWHFVQTPSHLNEHEYNCQPYGKTHPTKLGLFIWQNPLDSKTQRGFHGKTHGTIQGSIIWQNPLDGKSHWGIHGKSHGTKIINLNFGWQQRQYTFRGAIMIFWRLIHISL